jgi:hypothetical protein
MTKHDEDRERQALNNNTPTDPFATEAEELMQTTMAFDIEKHADELMKRRTRRNTPMS